MNTYLINNMFFNKKIIQTKIEWKELIKVIIIIKEHGEGNRQQLTLESRNMQRCVQCKALKIGAFNILCVCVCWEARNEED